MNIETLLALNLADEKSASEALEAIKQNPTLVNEASKDNGLTALHAAARDGNFKLVLAITTQQLIQNHSLDVQDFSGNTALHLAFSNNQWEIVTFLLSQEADKDILNNNGVPACDLEAWKKHSFSKEFSTKVMPKLGDSKSLSHYLKENYVQANNVNEGSQLSVSEDAGADTDVDIRIGSGAEVGGEIEEERKRQADKSTVKITNAEKTTDVKKAADAEAAKDAEADTFEFEEIAITTVERSQATLEARLAMAKKLVDKSYARQAQQLLEGAGIGVLNVYNALSDLPVPGPASLLSRISIKGYFA